MATGAKAPAPTLQPSSRPSPCITGGCTLFIARLCRFMTRAPDVPGAASGWPEVPRRPVGRTAILHPSRRAASMRYVVAGLVLFTGLARVPHCGPAHRSAFEKFTLDIEWWCVERRWRGGRVCLEQGGFVWALHVWCGAWSTSACHRAARTWRICGCTTRATWRCRQCPGDTYGALITAA